MASVNPDGTEEVGVYCAYWAQPNYIMVICFEESVSKGVQLEAGKREYRDRR